MYEKLQELRARREAGERGFTLIELLVVVVIIGILIAVAIPLYLNYEKGAHNKSAQSDLRNLISVEEQCYTDGGAYVESGDGIPNKIINSAQGGATSATITCDGATPPTTEKINVSDGVKITFTDGSNGTAWAATAVYKNQTPYYYDSAKGGAVEESPTAAPTS